MCIIASIPKGVGVINESTLQNMTNNNSHGFGVSYIKNDEIKIYKTMDSKKFVSNVMEIQSKYSKSSDILIHCRIATSGNTDIKNCHPFKVDNNTVFAHNGVLDCVEPTQSMSDTRMFNKVFLKNMQPNFLGSIKVREFIGEIINSDKMVFQTINPALDKNTYIINKDLGVEQNGIWFSNNSYKARNLVSNYTYDNNSCSIYEVGYEQNDYAALDYVQIIADYGSIADYISTVEIDNSVFDEFDEIVERANELPNQIVMHTYDNDNVNLFSTSKKYNISKFVNDEIKELISSIVVQYGLFQNLDNMTITDLDNLCIDCFGYGLPTIIETKVTV